MDATSPRWRQVTPSQHDWEADALETLRVLLPDSDPYQVWTNFEFTDGGRIHEADALVVTPKGVFLIEIKSWSGKVTGDQGTWVQRRRDGTTQSYSNPARLNTSKVRSLASLLKRNWTRGPNSTQLPFIESLVWFSNPSLTVALPPELWPQVAIADNNDDTRNVQTLTEAIIDIGEAEAKRAGFKRITAAQSDQFAKTMERIGFKESTRKRTAGSYELQLPAFAERGSTQDFAARHKVNGLEARVRIYSNVVGASAEDAKALKDAATREFMATRNLPIDGVVRAIDMDMTDFGPAVIFEAHPKAVRLDRFLAERADELDAAARLHIVEQLASTLREMHSRRITHRMLTPESVWLRPARTNTTDGGVTDGQRWDPLVSDFCLAAREATTTTTVSTYSRVGSLPPARTGVVEVVLGDPAMETYLAPESFTDSNADGVALDVFGLGALTYLLFTGRPPAAGRNEMRDALGSSGLSVSAVMAEVEPQVESFVRRCTTPIVSERIADMTEAADAVSQAFATVTGTETAGEAPDPLIAQHGDVLGDRFEVKRRLGKGSTAVALWCHDRAHDRQVVLKVALNDNSAVRLRLEADAIVDLRHDSVVELYETVELTDRTALVLSFAGERSLAGYLRSEGAVSTEFLRRWGQDLLEAVRHLEMRGVSHRDIKPDNLGIVEMGRHKKSHLVLFDFSLAGTSAEDTTAGTPPYLDPFLEDYGRRVFDLAAERYAAAVTIHEMATGETPTWGDGQTNPAYLPADVGPTLLEESIDEEVRAPVLEFLTRALSRNAAARFDTADDMARAWAQVFADWEAAEPGSDSDHSGTDTDTAGASAGSVLPGTLSLDDPIASLDTSKKVRSALRKLDAQTVRQVASIDPVAVNKTRGVSVKTRKAVLRLRAGILERFAQELATESDTTGQPETPPDTPRSSGEDTHTTAAGESTTTALARPDLDQLGLRLVPPQAKRGRKGKTAETIRSLLGLDADAAHPDEDWSSLTTVAQRQDLTRAAVSASFQKARKHWASSPELMSVTSELLDIVADLGGVAGVSELAAPLVDALGSGNDDTEARVLANAVARAVLESGSPAAEWFSLRRYGHRTLVAINGPEIARAAHHDADDLLDGVGLDPAAVHTLSAFDPTALIDLAVSLGGRADEMVDNATVVSSSDAVPALRAVRSGAGQPLSDARLVRLAAAASGKAVANTASDLVRRSTSAVDALRLTRTALVGATHLTADEITARVAARFPTTDMPGRPALDHALTAAGLPLTWSDEAQGYVSTASAPGRVRTMTKVGARKGTVVSTGGTTVAPAAPTDPEITAAIEIDERLAHSVSTGGFLALRVPTDRLADARRGLARFQSQPPGFTVVDLEAVFLDHLRAVAQRRGIDWSNLEGADDPDDPNWHRLSIVTADAVEATIEEVTEHERVIAWFPGALVRHAPRDGIAPLDRLRDAATSGEHRLQTLWLVVLGSLAEAMPMVDGTPVPALAASERLDLTNTWLGNDHRSGEMSA